MKKKLTILIFILNSLILISPVFSQDDTISQTKYFQKLNPVTNSPLINFGMENQLLVGYEKIETSGSTEDGVYYNIQPGFFIEITKKEWYISNKTNTSFFHNSRLNDIKLLSFDNNFSAGYLVKKIFFPGLGVKIILKDKVSREAPSSSFQENESAITSLKQANSFIYFNFEIIENLFFKNTLEYKMIRYNEKLAKDELGFQEDKKDKSDELLVATLLSYTWKINDFSIEPRTNFQYSFIIAAGDYNTNLKWSIAGGLKFSYLKTDFAYDYKYINYDYYMRELDSDPKASYYHYHTFSLSNSSLKDITFSASFTYSILNDDLNTTTNIYDFIFSITIPIYFHKGFEVPVITEKDSGSESDLVSGGGSCVGGTCSI